MSYTTKEIQDLLEANFGELILIMDSDAYDEHPELHVHDTTFHHNDNQIELDLTDGKIRLDADNIESWAYHQQSLDDLGI